MENFSNREIATFTWIGLGLGYCVWNSSLRESLGALVTAFFQSAILVSLALFLAYVAIMVELLRGLGFWDASLLKTTIMWAMIVGTASMVRTIRSSDGTGLLQKWIADNLKIIVVIEFVVTFYSAPLLVELVLVPALALLGAMLAYAQVKDEYRSVARFLNGVLVLTGLALMGYALYRVASEFNDFVTLQTLQDFYTPPVLSFLLLPFLFGLSVYITYEKAFLRLRITIPDFSVRTYAKCRAVLAFRCNLESLRRWARNTAISRPQNREAVDSGIREVVAVRARENNPPDVSPQDGWSPHVAIRFLDGCGLITDDYHRSFEDTWCASTPYFELGDGLMPDNIAYYVEGNAHAAKQLRLVLNVNNPGDPSASEVEFDTIARSLMGQTFGEDSGAVAERVLAGGDPETSTFCGRIVSLWRDDWKCGIRGGYTKTLTIGLDTGPDSSQRPT